VSMGKQGGYVHRPGKYLMWATLFDGTTTNEAIVPCECFDEYEGIKAGLEKGAFFPLKLHRVRSHEVASFLSNLHAFSRKVSEKFAKCRWPELSGRPRTRSPLY